MLKTRLLVYATFAALMAAGTANAADPAAGQSKYESTCMACHGAKGIAIAPIYPNLAGQKDQYLVQQLKNFRSGARTNPIMQPMAKNLTDTDIVDIAAFLSSLKPV